MRHLSAVYQTPPRPRRSLSHFQEEDKENMNNVVRYTTPSKKKQAVSGINMQTPPKFRRNSFSIVDDGQEGRYYEPDITTNEDFSFSKLRCSVEDFEKQQKDHLLKSASKKKVDQSESREELGSAMKNKNYTSVNSIGSHEESRCGSQSPEEARDDAEDFSFRSLKSKATTMEKQNTKNTDSRDRISFSGRSPNRCPTPQKIKTPLSSKKNIPKLPLQNVGPSYQNNRNSGSTRRPIPEGEHFVLSPRSQSAPRSAIRNTGLSEFAVPQINRKSQEESPLRTLERNTIMKTRKFDPKKYKFKPSVQRKEVEATDNKNASVQQLSEWLGDDPFGNRKLKVIRKDSQILMKSRAFETDPVNIEAKKETRVDKERQHFPSGKVSQGKSWLQNAFGEENQEDDLTEASGVLEKKKKLESALKHKI